tara:strand:+ start:3122 stop:4057 length:936 start_codon:yes stop_codon:yes gene_type:complete
MAQKQSNNSDFIEGKIYDILHVIAEKGTIQEKIFGLVLTTAIDSMTEDKDSPNGIHEMLGKVIDMGVDMKSFEKGFVDPQDLSLFNIGTVNIDGLIEAFKNNDENSIHSYSCLTRELDENPLSEEKKSYIEKRVEELNSLAMKGSLTSDELSAAMKAIIDDANKKFGGNDLVEILDTVHSENTLKNRMSESLWNLYIKYNRIVNSNYSNDKEKSDNKENFFALNIIKALMIVHRLSLTREMAGQINEHADFYVNITSKLNEIAKKEGVSIADFFKVKKLTPNEIFELEKDILANPDIDKDIKDLLNGLNLN